MGIYRHTPEQLPVRRVHRIRIPTNVPEERGHARRVCLQGADHDPAADSRGGFERPMDAAGLRIKRIDVSGIRADEDVAVDNGLSVERSRSREAKSPFQLEP